MNFGELLKEIRKKNGDSMRSLAEKLDIPHTYVQKIENENYSVSKKVINKLLKTYPMEKAELLHHYLEEYLPEEVKKEFNFGANDFLFSDLKKQILNLDIETQKNIYQYILEKVELHSIKNGSYEKKKLELEKLKEKINTL